MDLFFILGIIGILLILIAFILENTGKGGKDEINYNILNLIGSLFLFLYAYSTNSVIFMVLNLIWVLISIYFIIKHFRKIKS
jgi:hypothetical protein